MQGAAHPHLHPSSGGHSPIRASQAHVGAFAFHGASTTLPALDDFHRASTTLTSDEGPLANLLAWRFTPPRSASAREKSFANRKEHKKALTLPPRFESARPRVNEYLILRNTLP